MTNDHKRPYIFVVCPFALPNLGGVESHIDKLLKFIVRSGYYAVLVTYQPLTRRVKGLTHEYGQDYEIHRISWFGYNWFNLLESYFPLQFLYLFPGLFVGSAWYYLKYYRKIKCIHAHGLVAGVVTRVLAKIRPKRTVISTHAVYSFEKHSLLSFLVKRLLDNFDVVLAVSELSKNEILKMGVLPEKVRVHPNWIDVETFRPMAKTDAKNKLAIKFDHNFLFVGRLIDKKGIELFCSAAANLKQYGFHVVGSGPWTDQVERYAASLPNLKFYGPLMQDNAEQLEKLVLLYNAVDYFVSPYLYDEGFSTTLIEALACGTKDVITDRGSPPTFLDHSVAEFLSPNPTTEELTAKLTKLANDSYDHTACRQFATDHFGFKNAEVIIKSYDKVLI